jgi:tetratricopeptide (TPR) repeat protein
MQLSEMILNSRRVLVKKLNLSMCSARSLALVLACGLLIFCYTVDGWSQQPSSQDGPIGLIEVSASAEANDVAGQLKAGMDFAVLAKERSIDPSSADGGYVGRLSAAHLPDKLKAVAETLRPGQISSVVPIDKGYAIVTVFTVAPKTQDLDAKRIYALTKSGAVLQDISISGLDEADAVFKQYPKPEGWDQDLSQPCRIRKESYAAAVARTEQFLASPPASIPPAKLQQAHSALAQLYAYQGDLAKSAQEWKKTYEIAQASVPETVPYVLESLGVTYLHLAEMENGSYTNSGTMDIFPPLNHEAHFEKEENANLAIEYLEKYLAALPTDLEVRWELNLAYVTIGGYPDKVPAKYLVPASSFASKENVGRFKDIGAKVGLDSFTEAGGLVVDDFDNDGQLDIVTSSWGMCEPLHLFHNNGNGTFTDRSAQAGLSEQLGGLNVIQGDYNNDGCMDLLVLRGGWELPMRRSLLKNNCDGTFTDVTKQSGLSSVVTASQTAVWADVDNDGWLDLLVGNENSPSQLFHNKGDGTFEDISHAAGIDKIAFSKGVTAADYDKDGFVDFYISNASGPNFLYHNNGNLTFTEVGRQAGVQAPYFSFAAWFFDYDNDGWPDLFVNPYFSSVEQAVRSYLGAPVSVETLKLYRNKHDGTFEDITSKVGLDKVMMPMGSNFGDVDNDGFLDVYLGMGNPSFATMLPHTLLRNDGGKSFVDITASSGTGELHKGHGIAFADLERRGFDDIVSANGGAVPADKHTLRLFQNPGNGNDWINLRLVGVKSNRSAVGAEIKITVESDEQAQRSIYRAIYRTVGQSSSFGGNPMEQHVGLGHAARIVAIDVWWPATKTRQHFADVKNDQFLEIKEFGKDYTRLDVKSVRMAEPSSGSKAGK